MIMILSDGGTNTAEVEKQLKLHGDEYCLFFSDVISASRYAKGNVLIGKATRWCMAKVYAENNITAVIDITEKTNSKLSRAALLACPKNIKYVKCVRCEAVEGAKSCLSYKQLADKIKNSKGNALIYAQPETVSEISRLAGEFSSKIYVVLPKDIVFDVDRALKYSIPLLNVIEMDMTDEKESVALAVEKVDADMVIFAAETEKIEEKAMSARSVGAEVIVTHSMGIEYPKIFSNARDAVIEIHT